MWGVVASVLGASVALAIVQTVYESLGSSRGDARSGKQEALPQPTPGERKPDNKWKAPLWQAAKGAAKKAPK